MIHDLEGQNFLFGYSPLLAFQRVDQFTSKNGNDASHNRHALDCACTFAFFVSWIDFAKLVVLQEPKKG